MEVVVEHYLESQVIDMDVEVDDGVVSAKGYDETVERNPQLKGRARIPRNYGLGGDYGASDQAVVLKSPLPTVAGERDPHQGRGIASDFISF